MTPASALLGRLALRCQPDARLVALVREDSDAAFEEIVVRYRRRLVAYAGGIVARDRAEDVVQESLVRALAAIRGADNEINLRPWLHTIVRNRALNDLRDEPLHEHLDESFDGVPQPPDIAARSEELAGVVEGVKALPEAQRRALIQRELEGRSHDEIAASLAVTPGAVRGLIFRARSSLRNAAGVMIPMPLLRALAGSSATGGAATVAAATGGGGAFKLGATLTVAALAIGSGVALHDHGGGPSDEATAKASHARNARTTPHPARSTSTDGGAFSSGNRVEAASTGHGTGEQVNSERGSSGSGDGPTSTSGGSAGPSPVSGSSGTGSGVAGGGDRSGGSSGPGPGGGGDTGDGGTGGGAGTITSDGGDGGGGSDGAGTITTDGGGGSDGGSGSEGGDGGTITLDGGGGSDGGGSSDGGSGSDGGGSSDGGSGSDGGTSTTPLPPGD